MPVVRINDATFADLSTLKTWYGTKTPSETIDRIVREAMEQLGMERDGEPETVATTSSDSATQFDIPPGLAFTKPLAATVNGKALDSPRWSSILLTMIGQVNAKGFEGKKLVRELAIPARDDQYEEEGFTYHHDLGISVRGNQRQTAGRKWTASPRSGASQSWSSFAGGKSEGPVSWQIGYSAVG